MFVKTVFSASEKFDSAPVKLMRGPCHLFVKRCLQLVRSVRRIQSVTVFFSAMTPGQHVREATQWFIHKLRQGAGPLKFFHSPSSGQAEMWTSGRGLCVATFKSAFPSDRLPPFRSAGSVTGSRLDARTFFCVLKYALNRSRSCSRARQDRALTADTLKFSASAVCSNESLSMSRNTKTTLNPGPSSCNVLRRISRNSPAL